MANLHVKKNTILYDIPFLSFVSLLLLFMGWRYGVISRAGSLLFCGLFVLFMLYLYKVSKKHKTEIPEPVNMSIFKMLLFIVFGIATLIIGAKLIVNSATNIAHFLNIPERVIGLTIVAFGTSLPELVTCVVAAFKRRSGIVIGNIVGSNLFNILFVLGITGLIQPIPFEHAFILDAALGVIATILLWILVFKDKKFNRTDGIIFLLIYITYTVLLVR